MATGDKVTAPRPRGESNMRLDLVDYHRLSATPQQQLEALIRTLIASPKATVASPTGERWTGSVTANPTGAADNNVRVDTAVFVGVDANGALVLKPAGTTLVAAIPATGTDHQVYIYMQDVAEDSQVRRKISATSPFPESGSAINVAFRQTAALYVRLGGTGTIQAQDAISGVTRALLFLGIANNVAGNVTFTPAANTLETVTVPVALPATSGGTTTGETTVTGSGASLREMVNIALHGLSRDRWKGSFNYTPSAANNFGAYTEPPGGIDAAYRGRTVITIGDDSNGVYGDVDVDKHPTGDVALQVAINALPADGGTIIILPGTVISTFLSAVTLPDGKSVTIKGNTQKLLDSSTSTIDTGSVGFVCAASATPATLTFENVTVTSTAAGSTGRFVELNSRWNLVVKDSTFIYQSAYAGVAPTHMFEWNGATAVVGDVLLMDSYFSYTNAATGGNGGIVDSGLAHTGTFEAVRCTMFGTLNTDVLVRFTDIRDNFTCVDCNFKTIGTAGGPSATVGVIGISLTSTDNTVREKVRRVVERCAFTGRTSGGVNRHMRGIVVTQVANLRVLECDFADSVQGVSFTTTGNLVADLMISRCTFDGIYGSPVLVTPGGGATTMTGLQVLDCLFNNVVGLAQAGAIKIAQTTATIKDVVIRGNKFYDFSVISESGMHSWSVTDNLFERSTLTTLQGIVLDTSVGGGNGNQILIADNVFKGHRHDTSVSIGLCVYVYVVNLTHLSVCRNVFQDIGNVVFAGASAAVHAVVRILTTTAGTVRVDENQFREVCSNMTGANAAAGILVHVDSVDMAATTLSISALSISRNQLSGGTGAGGSGVHPVLVRHALGVTDCTVSDNDFMYDGSVLTVRVFGSFDFLGTFYNLTVSNNRSFFSGSVAAWTENVLALSGTFRAVLIRGNTWTNTQINGFAATWGITFTGATIQYLIFQENMGYIFGDSAATNGKFNYTPATSITTSSPAEPGAGAYWGGTNLNIGRN